MQDTAGEAGTSSEVMYSYGPPLMAEQKQDDQLERGSEISVRVARDDDDDDDDDFRGKFKIESLT